MRKGIEAGKLALDSSAVAADKYKGLIGIATGGAIVLYGMYLFSQCK